VSHPQKIKEDLIMYIKMEKAGIAVFVDEHNDQKILDLRDDGYTTVKDKNGKAIRCSAKNISTVHTGLNSNIAKELGL